MKRLFLFAALTATLSFAPIASQAVAHAEEGYSEMDNGAAGMGEEGQWLTDEPAAMEDGEAPEQMEDGEAPEQMEDGEAPEQMEDGSDGVELQLEGSEAELALTEEEKY